MSTSLNFAPSPSPLPQPRLGPTFPHLFPQMSFFSGFRFSEPCHGYEDRIGGKLAELFFQPKKGSNRGGLLAQLVSACCY